MGEGEEVEISPINSRFKVDKFGENATNCWNRGVFISGVEI